MSGFGFTQNDMCLPSLTSAAKAILAIPSHGAENIPWQRLRGPGFWETQFDGIIEAHDGLAGIAV